MCRPMEETLIEYAGTDALLDVMHAVYLDHMMPIYRILQNG